MKEEILPWLVLGTCEGELLETLLGYIIQDDVLAGVAVLVA